MSGAAAAAAYIQALKASGCVIRLDETAFMNILARSESPLVVVAPAGFLRSGKRYLTSYKGLAFWTKASFGLELPRHCEVIESKSMWMPA